MHSCISPDTRKEMLLTHARVRAICAHIAPPRGVVACVRWAALVVVLLVAGHLLVSSCVTLTSPTTRALATLAVAWLCCSWLRAYLSRGFSLVGCFSEGAALLVLGLTLDDPLRVLSLLYVALAFRSLRGSARDALTVALVYLTAHLAAAGLSAGGGLASMLRPEIAQQAPGVLVVAGLMQLLVATLIRNARAAACERTLAAARTALSAAVDQADFHAATMEATIALLAEGSAEWVTLELSDAESPARPGLGDPSSDGVVDLHLLLAPLHARLLEGTPIRRFGPVQREPARAGSPGYGGQACPGGKRARGGRAPTQERSALSIACPELIGHHPDRRQRTARSVTRARRSNASWRTRRPSTSGCDSSTCCTPRMRRRCART